jgi:hypothetical protein
MNGYELSRQWFDFAFEHPNDITPVHGVLYLFIVEHCNRMGWKEKFGLPTTMAKEAIGVRSYNTYKNALEDLVSWGFVIMVERSKNQFSSNIVALSKFDKATDKALDKALIKHGTKQRESTRQSIDSIDKQETYNLKPITNIEGVPPSLTTENETITFIQPQKKDNTGRGNFTAFNPPTVEDVIACFKSAMNALGLPEDSMGGYSELGSNFWNHYESQGWKKGNEMQITSWRPMIGSWLAKQKGFAAREQASGKPKSQTNKPKRSWD